jgi:hypothetical protein
MIDIFFGLTLPFANSSKIGGRILRVGTGRVISLTRITTLLLEDMISDKCGDAMGVSSASSIVRSVIGGSRA